MSSSSLLTSQTLTAAAARASTVPVAFANGPRWVITDLRPLERARAAILSRMNRVPASVASDLSRLVAAGTLREPVQLSDGAQLVRLSADGGVSTAESAEYSLQPVAYYGYDPFDRRVIRLVSSSPATWLHVYDGWDEVEELVGVSGQNLAARQFVWGERQNELVAFRSYALATGWRRFFCEQLGHESIVRIQELVETKDGQGQVIDTELVGREKLQYDPWGQPEVFSWSGGLIGEWSGLGDVDALLLEGASAGPGDRARLHALPVLPRGVGAVPDCGSDWGVGGCDEPGNAYGYASASPMSKRDPFGLSCYASEPSRFLSTPLFGMFAGVGVPQAEGIGIELSSSDHLRASRRGNASNVETSLTPRFGCATAPAGPCHPKCVWLWEAMVNQCRLGLRVTDLGIQYSLCCQEQLDRVRRRLDSCRADWQLCLGQANNDAATCAAGCMGSPIVVLQNICRTLCLLRREFNRNACHVQALVCTHRAWQ